MKKVFIGLGIGCGVLMLGGFALIVGGTWYAKKKLGGALEHTQAIAATQKKVEAKQEALDRKYPFQRPPAGTPLTLTADRVETYLAIREDALPLYAAFQDKAKDFEKRHQNAGKIESVGAAMEGAGMVADLVQQLRDRYLDSLEARHMSPREFGAITGALYSAALGAANPRAELDKQIAAMDAQLASAAPEQKANLEQQKQALQQAAANLPASKDVGVYQANAELLSRYKDRIEKSVNPAFDAFVLGKDAAITPAAGASDE